MKPAAPFPLQESNSHTHSYGLLPISCLKITRFVVMGFPSIFVRITALIVTLHSFSLLRVYAALLYFRRMSNIAVIHSAPDTPPPLTRPPFLSLIVAGFPSPTDDHLDRNLDLHDLLIQHPAATFYVRLSGDSMKGAELYDGDILVVDRSLEPKHNDIVIARPTQHPVESPTSLSNAKWMPAYSRETGFVGDEALRLGYLAYLRQ